MSNLEVNFFLNNKKHTIKVHDDETLLYTLRNRFHLTGAKHGCNSGQCGACTVVIDDRAIKSCKIYTSQVDGCRIITIEGLALDEKLHPLQKAFLLTGAVQCGFCTPGMIMAAYALLLKYPHPTRNTIRQFMRSNLCRCTGYQPIENAILMASEQIESTDDLSWKIGDSPLRFDGIEKVTGKALFAADLSLHNELVAGIIWARISSGYLEELNAEKAQNLDGVRVITAKDIPGKNAVGRWQRDRPLLVEKRIRFYGDAIAIIVAEDEETLKKAHELITVKTKKTEGVFDVDKAIRSDATKIHPEGNIAAHQKILKSSLKPIPQTTYTYRSQFHTPFLEHALIEPEAATAYWEGETLIIYTPSQNVFMDRIEISEVLGLNRRDMKKIRVIQAVTGAAFGKREDILAAPLVALAAYLTNQNVRLIMNRDESFFSTTKRHPMSVNHTTVCDDQMKIQSQTISILADTGSYASWAPNILRKAAVHATGPYEIPSVNINAFSIYTNNAFSGAMRGFGATQSLMAAEVQMNRIARHYHWDPLDFRLKNILTTNSQTATSQKIIDGEGLKDSLVMCTNHFGWREKQQRSRFKDDHLTGTGLACAFYGIGYGNSILDKGQVEIIIYPGGKTVLHTGAIDYGQGAMTIFAQLMIETLGVPRHFIDIISADTERTPDSGSTVASRQTFVTGNAVIKACKKLKQDIIHALPLSENEKDGVIVDHRGWFQIDGQIIPWSRLISIAGIKSSPIQSKARFINHSKALDPSMGMGDVYSTYSFSTACAEISIDIHTGQINVLSVVSAHDSGRILNPTLAKSQVTGGVVMAAGMILSEKYNVKNGIPESLDFDSYNIPRFGCVKNIEVLFTDTHDPQGPLGAKGIGEPAMLAAGPAILSAIEDATDEEFNRIPISKNMLLSIFKHQEYQ